MSASSQQRHVPANFHVIAMNVDIVVLEHGPGEIRSFRFAGTKENSLDMSSYDASSRWTIYSASINGTTTKTANHYNLTSWEHSATGNEGNPVNIAM